MTPLVSAIGLSKSYGRRSVLRDVNVEARRGEVLGFVGPNGAGKTTLLRLLVGLLKPDAGAVYLDREQVPRALGRIRVAYFAGGSTLPPTVRAGRWRQLFHGADAAPESRPIGQLSRGTRQLLGLRALVESGSGGPDLIVFDEPWEGLDPDASRWLTQSIRCSRDRGAAVLVSSHRLHELGEVCDRCAFLMDGSLKAVEVGELPSGGALSGAALLAAFDDLRQMP